MTILIDKPDKAILRQTAQQRRMALTAEQRASYSTLIMQRLHRELEKHPASDNLLSYRSMNSEVDTAMLFTSPASRIFAPRTHSHEHMEWVSVSPSTNWIRGALGVMEPETGELWHGGMGTTILLCPLTAFDRHGNRLGMGKGCFDFWLSQQRQHLQAIIGLAFSCQEMATIPAEDHDIPMDMVMTEKECIICRTS